MLAVLAVLSIARADDTALTFSYRGLAGLSARVEAPISGSAVSWIAEAGGSGWIVYGDDPAAETASPTLLRIHGKVGADWHHNKLYFGPRAIAAVNFTSDDLRLYEGAVQGMVGLNAPLGQHGKAQIGVGLGVHAFTKSEADEGPRSLVVPLPALELRFGPTWGG